MADTKNSGLSELTAVAADDDLLYLVDVSDTSMAVTGTSKKNKAKYYLRTNGMANTLGANIDANNYNFTGGGTVAASAMRAANYYGGTASGGTATISSTTHATKGKVLLGSVSAFDEVNNRLGVGTVTPSAAVYVKTGSSDGVFLDASAYPVMRFLVAGSAAYEMFYDQTISTFKFGIPNTAVHMLIDSAGKVGIGVAPSYTLDVSGTVQCTQAGGSWATGSYNTGWADYGGGYSGAKYKKFGDIVFLKGLVVRNSGSETTIFTLPSGYRPPASILFAAIANDAVARIGIDSSGNVILQAGVATPWVSLNGITFSSI